MAAPAPWTARAAISAPSEGASPQATSGGRGAGGSRVPPALVHAFARHALHASEQRFGPNRSVVAVACDQ
jgi:hypothetical protein